jgi:ElaA protein
MSPSIAWQWIRFADLTPNELYALLTARGEVFVVEQRCAFLDMDGLDRDSMHLLGWARRDDQADRDRALAAYLRLVEPDRKYTEPSIGRVLTTAAFRGIGLGRAVMREGLRRAAAEYPAQPVRIGAQRYLERFYESLGFRVASAPYDEDGIEHVQMLCPAPNSVDVIAAPPR